MQAQQYAYDSNQKKWLPLDISVFSSATVAKQDEAIALLNKLTQQLDFANGIGAVQPSQTAIASSTVQEILPLSGTRKRVRITNHSPTDSILIELNGDATVTQGQIIGAGGTWESPGIEEARSRITVISATGNDVPISYQETSNAPFIVGDQTVLNQNANIIDLKYSIIIFGVSSSLTSLAVELFEVGDPNPIAVNNYTTGLEPGNTINAEFIGIDGFNGIEPKEFYLIVSGG